MKSKNGLARMAMAKGFTIIELVVVVAIIVLLAGIVTANVISYTNKAKIRRAYAEVESIKKALHIFKAQYGDYPCKPVGTCTGQYKIGRWRPSSGGDPYLEIDGVKYYFSEILNLNWTQNNATFFCQDCYYEVTWETIIDEYNDAMHAYVRILSGTVVGSRKLFGQKTISCFDNPNCNEGTGDFPFKTTPWPSLY